MLFLVLSENRHGNQTLYRMGFDVSDQYLIYNSYLIILNDMPAILVKKGSIGFTNRTQESYHWSLKPFK